MIDERRVREIIAAVYSRSPEGHTLSWEELQDDSALYSVEAGEESLGLDSLDAVEIATELEEAFDVVMPAEIDPATLHTVRQVVAELQRLVDEQHGGAA
jgi:acyl carrier protein